MALEALDLARPGLDWYAATRHTFASHYVMAGGTLEELQVLLGHASITITQRYSHLRHDLFPASRSGILGSRWGSGETASMKNHKGKSVTKA